MNTELLANTTEYTNIINKTLHANEPDESGNNFRGQTPRTNHRYMTFGLMAVISDNKSKYYSIVDDLSEQGFQLGQIQRDFDETTEECTALVLAPFDNIAMSAKPRWVKTTNRGMHKTIGFQIDNPPDDWQNFIQKLKTKTSDCSYLLQENKQGGIH